MALALTMGALPAAFAVPPKDDRTSVDLVDLPAAQAAEGQDGGPLADMTTAEAPLTLDYEPKKTAVPAADTETEPISGLTAGVTKPVGTLPVEVGAPDTATAEQAAALEGSWQARVIGQAELAAAGVEGVAFSVIPPATATGTAVVALNYTKFAELYGANWADRLKLVRFPACFLDTPDVEGCSEPVEVATRNTVEPQAGDRVSDGQLDGTRRIEATIDVASLTDASADPVGPAAPASAAKAASATSAAVFRAPKGGNPKAAGPALWTGAMSGGGPSVMVAVPKASGAKGDFSATPLPSAGSWSAGTGAGGFSYTYAMQAPVVPGGPAPELSLSYNSQAADGRTSATNNQVSWIGEGWEYNPGSITRTYRACRDDRTNGNNADRKTGDLCWGSHNATLTLGGMTTELVRDDSDGTWHTANGDGSRIELRKDVGLANGDADGEYWVVTTRDGTQYHFGRHKLPGWSDNGAEADDPLTNSVFTVPVSSNQSDEPCYDSSFAASFCDEGWRWNLDYVVDPHGNAMSLWWAKEYNYFAKNLKYSAPTKYVRGGYLKRIDYGQRSGTLFSSEPTARVAFTVAERCFSEGNLTCDPDNFTSGDFAKNRIWFDTPADLHCSNGQGKRCLVPVPTFWSRIRLAEVKTSAQRTQGSTTLSPVDTWTLEQTLPSDLTDEGTALWLGSITRTGHDPQGETVRLRPVEFVSNSEPMYNRVKKGAKDPDPTFDRLRIQRVINEYGGETLVEYSSPTGPCATGTGFPKPEANTGLCFPAYWHPDPDKADETIDWFNKYVVRKVTDHPAVNGVKEVTTSYEYGETGATATALERGGAWALNQAEFSKKKTRTYDQWRGYSMVRTVAGAESTVEHRGTTRSMGEVRYFRGMHGDPLPAPGGTRSVPVKDASGAKIADDLPPFQGRVAETLTYDGYGGHLISRSVDHPTAVELASRSRDDGLDALKAHRVQTDATVTVTRSSGTREGDTRDWRTTKATTTYEPTYGLPVKVEVLGDTERSNDESCSVMSYVHNVSDHIIGLSKETLTTAGTCAEASTATGGDWISGGRVAYDGGAFGAAPTTGLATTTWDVSGKGGGWIQNGTVAYDAYGRPTTTTDAAGNAATTTYEPAVGQVYSVTTKNALGHTSVSYLEPGRGTAVREVDANGRSTSYAYDALGRTVAGWAPGQAVTGLPTVKMTYNSEPNEPVSVVTATLNERDDYDRTVVILDGLGRERQRQMPAVGGKGRLITDTFYNHSGTVERTNNAYYVEGAPQPVLWSVLDHSVPNATLYSYDGLGRVLTETPFEKGAAKPEKTTRNEYGFDYSVAIPPVGAPAQRSFSDALGRTVRVDTFTNATRTAARSTEYEFDPRGNRSKATDHKGNVWSWTYDARGRLTSSTDPDTGTSTTTYDVLNRPVNITDGRGVSVWNGYDKLSRPTEQRLTSSAGTLLTSQTYDSLPGGLGLPVASTRYTDGLPYTQSVLGYTDDYQPTGMRLTLPASIAQAYGFEQSYSYAYDYTKMGLPKSVALPAAGALGAEKVVTRYNDEGLPISTSGLDWYTADVSYSVYGEVLRAVTGEHPNRVWTSNLIDERSGALEQTFVDRESSEAPGGSGGRVNARSYAYDHAGNVTKIEDRANGTTDRQCFRYDYLGQLTRAWTSDEAECAVNADPERTPVSVTAGPAGDGYHKSYTYDEMGNRTELLDRYVAKAGTQTVLDPSKDARTTYTYGAADGTQPHTLTGMSSTYRTDAGAMVKADLSRAYDKAGNTVSRVESGDEQTLSWTWDGKVEKISGFGEKGAGAWTGLAGKCLDLSGGSKAAGTPLQLYVCNGSRPQQFRIQPMSPAPGDAGKGALKVLDQCATPKDGATAAGTPVVIAACNGAPEQVWTAVEAGGKLKHVASGKCMAVPGGDSADGTDLQLATCDTGGAAQSWIPADETTYVYGPSGERLLALTSGARTLYLGDTTVTMAANGAHSHTERYYAHPGAPTVMRSAMGSSASSLSAQVTDQTGSSYVSVRLAPGNEVQFNKLDAFGVKRNEHGGWRSHRGFIDGADDRSTGLVHLGAREYEPTTGRFISADPVLDLDDPIQKNGYLYCENNPVTFADPTGLVSAAPGGGGGGGGDYGAPSSGELAWANGQLKMTMMDIIQRNLWDLLKNAFIDWGALQGCFSRGDIWACGSLIMDAIPFTKLLKLGGKVMSTAWRTYNAISAWKKSLDRARQIIAQAQAAKRAAEKALAAKKAAALKAAQAAKEKAQKSLTQQAKKGAEKVGNAVQKTEKAMAKAKKSVAAGYEKVRARITGKTSCNSDSNSFAPGTPVLMADGSTKPIEEVKTGDEVVATDPETGETRVETVAAEITGKGVKHLVAITVDTDGDSGAETETITATGGHPFWVPELRKWINATDLKAGQWLRTGAGTLVQVAAVKRWTSSDATVHNLTVSDLHTYYVLAGAAPVLVHNCGVTRGGNESTYSISHDASGSGVIADLDSDGILTMMMHNNPDKGSPLRGKAMFDEVMGHFGDRVQGVQGIWVYGDNLGGFNEAVRGGASLVSAAKGTWTGRQAARYGFTRARIDEAVPRLDGDFQQVLATFRR